MRNKEKLTLVLFLSFIVVAAAFVGCGETKKTEFDLLYTGAYFQIPHNKGFTTGATSTGAQIYNDRFNISIEAKEYEGAALDDLDSVSKYTDSLRNNLTKLEESTWNTPNATGILFTGYADSRRGIGLVVPLDGHVVTVYTKETPTIDADFDEAYSMIESFEIRDTAYFQNHPIIVEPPSNSDSTTDETDPTNGMEIDSNTSSVEPGDTYSNSFLSTTLPAGWELTADEDIQTVFGSTGEYKSNLLALSIQYVTSEKDTLIRAFIADFAKEVGGTPEVKTVGNTKYEFIKGVHTNYNEYHIFTRHSSGIPIIITAITTESALPAEVVFVLENLKVK